MQLLPLPLERRHLLLIPYISAPYGVGKSQPLCLCDPVLPAGIAVVLQFLVCAKEQLEAAAGFSWYIWLLHFSLSS